MKFYKLLNGWNIFREERRIVRLGDGQIQTQSLGSSVIYLDEFTSDGLPEVIKNAGFKSGLDFDNEGSRILLPLQRKEWGHNCGRPSRRGKGNPRDKYGEEQI